MKALDTPKADNIDIEFPETKSTVDQDIKHQQSLLKWKISVYKLLKTHKKYQELRNELNTITREHPYPPIFDLRTLVEFTQTDERFKELVSRYAKENKSEIKEAEETKKFIKIKQELYLTYLENMLKSPPIPSSGHTVELASIQKQIQEQGQDPEHSILEGETITKWVETEITRSAKIHKQRAKFYEHLTSANYTTPIFLNIRTGVDVKIGSGDLDDELKKLSVELTVLDCNQTPSPSIASIEQDWLPDKAGREILKIQTEMLTKIQKKIDKKLCGFTKFKSVSYTYIRIAYPKVNAVLLKLNIKLGNERTRLNTLPSSDNTTKLISKINEILDDKNNGKISYIKPPPAKPLPAPIRVDQDADAPDSDREEFNEALGPKEAMEERPYRAPRVLVPRLNIPEPIIEDETLASVGSKLTLRTGKKKLASESAEEQMEERMDRGASKDRPESARRTPSMSEPLTRRTPSMSEPLTSDSRGKLVASRGLSSSRAEHIEEERGKDGFGLGETKERPPTARPPTARPNRGSLSGISEGWGGRKIKTKYNKKNNQKKNHKRTKIQGRNSIKNSKIKRKRRKSTRKNRVKKSRKK